MKTVLTILGLLLLLVSCQKEKQIPKQIQHPDQLKIAAWYNNLNTISKNTPDSIAFYANKMEQMARNQSKEYQAMAAFMKGVYHSNTASYQLGNKHFETALQLLEHSKADTLQAKVYDALANNLKITGDYPKAFNYLYRALKIFEKHQDHFGISSTYAIIGEINFQKGNIAVAKENIEKAINALKDNKANLIYLSAAHSLANVYGMSGNFQKAISIDEEAIRIADSIDSPKMKVAFLDNKANCYMYSNRLDSAQYYFQECLKIDLQNGNEKQIADSYSNLGQLYFLKNDLNTAERFALKSISILKPINAKPNLDKVYGFLVSIYSKQRRFEKASEIQQKQFQNYKLMIDEKEASSFAEYKTVYETQKKESKIQSLVQEAKIRQLKINEQASIITKRNYLIVAIVFLLIGFVSIGYSWKSKQALKNVLAKEKIIRDTEEQERHRIARDIHDDLGSGLSKINFLSELIFQKASALPEIRSNSEAIKETAVKMIDNMRDLIWALNPENTTLVNLVVRMREYTTDYLEDYAIAVRYEIQEFLPQTAITKESHRELFMVVKETINNIAKYAQATEVNFEVALSASDFILTIRDNGIGFDTTLLSKGNGLKNIIKRIEAFGGICNITSANQKGTTVDVRIPLQQIIKKPDGNTVSS